MEADLVRRNRIPYTAIPAAGVHGVGWRLLPRNAWQLSRGVLASRRILAQFRPDLLLFTGGFVAVPMALAGFAVPSLLFVPDIEPGLALKVLARFADRIAVTTADSRQYFQRSAPVTVTGYPTRADLRRLDRAAARQAIGLEGDGPVVLVTGGSKGARSLNRAFLAILPELPATVQALHLTGNLDWPEIQAAAAGLPAEVASRYHPLPYLHDMGAALAAADLVVSRAGASTLGEYPLYGLPAILVPSPYAWRYQKVNAGYLVERGAALMIADQDLSSQLLPALRSLLGDLPRLLGMRTAMASLARPEAARDIARLAQDLVAAPQRRA